MFKEKVIALTQGRTHRRMHDISSLVSGAKKKINFGVTFILMSANAFNLDQSKILSFGEELKTHSYMIDFGVHI